MRSPRLLALLLASLSFLACGRGQQATARPAQTARPDAAPGAEPTLGPKVFPLLMAPALDHPGRDSWQKPGEVIAALDIALGARVADIGCGTGYFTVRLADAVGPGGKVIAVDIQPGMLDILGARLTPAQARVVETRLGEPLAPLAPADSLDLVLCANTLHEVDDGGQAAFTGNLAGALRPGGRLAMLNWLPASAGLGPPTANRIAPERVRRLAEEAGLVPVEEIDLLSTHSFLVFARPGEGSRPGP